jgi:CAAX prenyl protease-like protein
LAEPLATSPRRVTGGLRVPTRSRHLLTRLLLVAGLFGLELVALTAWLDTSSLDNRPGISGLIGAWGPWLLRGVIAYSAIVVTCGWFTARDELERLWAEGASWPIRWRFATAHVLAIVMFAKISAVLFASTASATSSSLLAVSWLFSGVVAIGLAAIAIVPSHIWIGLLRGTGFLWGYALIAVVAAGVLGTAIQSVWQPTSRLTFALTKAWLMPFVGDVFADPSRLAVGTTHFYVIVEPGCSGLEGVGLMVAFGTMWLVMTRRECRFPQAAALLPAAVVVIFLLNAARLALLVLIGDAGAKQIVASGFTSQNGWFWFRVATNGFHSQAGWILFNMVAVGFCVALRRISFFTRTPPMSSRDQFANPTAAYLVPFLGILAAGMLAGAAAGDFEWLYPLRFLTAGIALWLYRRSYATLGWRFDWLGPVVGMMVFALWIGIDRLLHPHIRDIVPSGLASSSAAGNTWIAFRVMAAVITVPLAEELAFRGFLLRRLIAADFEAVSFRQFSWFAILVSSIVFGMLHGTQWFAGVIAGLAFAVTATRRGRIGTAVWAHATCNALLAAYVLTYQRWHLW